MIITIHQPEHLPWLGLIDKISRVDIFVILDTVQYKKNDFQNRNKIRTQKGFSWLTVPIKKHPLKTGIKDIEISQAFDWRTRYLNLIKENYKNAKHFSEYYTKIKFILDKDYKLLSDLNCELIKFILGCFDIKIKTIKSSEMDLPKFDNGTEVVFGICKALSATEYVTGSGGKNYLDLLIFEENSIKISFQEFQHSIYKQQYEPFIPYMSSIDLLFNYGPESKDILFGKDIERVP